jgi:heat shock protein HslJ
MARGRAGRLGLAALLGLLTACASLRGDADAPPLDGTAWLLAELPGHARVANVNVTLAFEDGNVFGSDGCNRFRGSYTQQGSRLEVSAQMAATMMACPDDVTAQARAFVAALAGARSHAVEGGRLRLLSEDGSTRAVLSAQSQALAGTTWEATGINNGRQAVVSLAAGTRATLAFGADGTASGSAGCNRFSTRYEADAGSLRFQPAAATRRMCIEPEGVMEQEQQFLAALATVATARIEGDRLELRSADGALALTLTRAASE